MKTDEIREKYLEFFKSKGHTVCPSDVLVPRWDKTVLFTPAGMNQFKDHFLGKVDLEFTRAATCQKCLRTGDIENVGRTAYHHTFFEMLGNFSFGDYFKRDAIAWAWEFLTAKRWLNISPERLTVSVYLDDDEAADIWHELVGLPTSRIQRMGEHDNFWPAGAPSDGPDGVCGPCSEIFFQPDSGEECEIWNLVFTQFERNGDPPDNLHPLPSKNIDTGMGLERIAATLQGVSTNFHIDILRPIVEAAAEVVGIPYDPGDENGRRLRRITDHIRACTMAIHENVYPGPQKEEYVIRRLLRRAVLQGHDMGVREPFLFKLVPEVANQMARPYPELASTMDRVAEVVKNEERRFLSSLDEGLARIQTIFAKMKASGQQMVDGSQAAELYTTYGIPAEVFASMSKEMHFDFDWSGYEAAIEQHVRDSGQATTGVMGDYGPIDDIKREVKSTEFVGYKTTKSTGSVVGLMQQTSAANQTPQLKRRKRLQIEEEVEQFVVLDRTPFYAESGGQVGDTGWLCGSKGKFEVVDTQKSGDVFIHAGRMVEGVIDQGDELSAVVDSDRREAIRRAHSATHVLHHALRQTLGDHAQQRGSKVADDWLRFDFSNQTAVADEHLSKIEAIAVDKVQSADDIEANILPLKKARQQGAMMLFGEKYPDPVRMISIGDYSKELCGGTHLKNSREVEAFELISEESVSAGTRRIEALTGAKAREFQESVLRTAETLASKLDVTVDRLPEAASELADEIKDLKKQLASGKRKENKKKPKPTQQYADAQFEYREVRRKIRETCAVLNEPMERLPERVDGMLAEISQLETQLEKMADAGVIDVDQMIAEADSVDGVRLIVMQLPGANPALMRQLIDKIRKKTGPVAVFFATSPGPGKVLLAAGISRELVDNGYSAGDWIKEVAPLVGGGGGGKPDLAQAGGKQPEKIEFAIEHARQYIKNKALGVG